MKHLFVLLMITLVIVVIALAIVYYRNKPSSTASTSKQQTDSNGIPRYAQKSLSDSYRIGDGIRHSTDHESHLFKPGALAKENARDYPGSIVDIMVQNADHENGTLLFPLLKKAVDKTYRGKKEGKNTLVMHIRLGDKFAGNDIADIKQYDRLKELLPKHGIKKVVFVIGMGARHDAMKYLDQTKKYVADLHETLKDFKPKVHEPGAPDQDFGYLYHAKNLMLGSGGFALLAACDKPKGSKLFLWDSTNTRADGKAVHLERITNPEAKPEIVLV